MELLIFRAEDVVILYLLLYNSKVYYIFHFDYCCTIQLLFLKLKGAK